MIIWLDANLPPILKRVIATEFGVAAASLRDLGLRNESDPVIFRAAKSANAIIMTKDKDYAALLAQHGPPPAIIHVKTGNYSNALLEDLCRRRLGAVLSKVRDGRSLVELSE